ncbi:DUF420 domain-containing protein [Rapidithrix thailandica]|uniref:DUF420 domain-containing protein n=1 Tax=Rapidithrix thailandica TaxID=413964 RepID=A0AAW9S8D1_9BACT
MSTVSQKDEKKYLILIGVLSVAIPLVVAVLLFMPQTGKLGDLDVSFLPHLNATLNTTTALCLVAGYMAIRKNNPSLHKTLMLSAFVLSSIFLISYVIYHYQGDHTLYGDFNSDGVLTDAEKAEAGPIRFLYYFVLLTHILCSVFVVPLVLLAIYFALSNNLSRHKKIVKWTFPVWTYVAFTGVIVYLLISPFYA